MITFAKISIRYGDIADAKISSKYGDAIRDSFGDASGSAGRWTLVLSTEYSIARRDIDDCRYWNIVGVLKLDTVKGLLCIVLGARQGRCGHCNRVTVYRTRRRARYGDLKIVTGLLLGLAEGEDRIR